MPLLDEDSCDECRQVGPLLLMTPVWMHDQWGCWEAWLCQPCLLSARYDVQVTVELPWSDDLPSTYRRVPAGTLPPSPKSGRDRAENSAPSGHTPDAAGGDRDWSQAS